jgi:predicted metal-dependent peptidase
LEANYGNSITVFGQEIEDIHKKTPEQIYDEFKIKYRKGGIGIGRVPGKKGGKDGNGKDGKGENGFDYHNYKNGEGLTEDQKRELEKEWKDRITEAYVTAKQAGKVPAGIERLIDNIHKSEVNWRTVLLREVQKALPSDYTYARPFKSSYSTGYYMPDVEKDKIDVVVAIDVSGSIGKQEYADFASEVIGMANAFRNRINIRFLTHDVTVHNDYLVENGNVEKIKRLKISGGGGTSHKDIMDYIRDKVRNAKVAIFLTDGYSDLESINLEDYRYKKIFVIQKNGRDDCIDKTRNKVIRLGGENYKIGWRKL